MLTSNLFAILQIVFFIGRKRTFNTFTTQIFLGKKIWEKKVVKRNSDSCDYSG